MTKVSFHIDNLERKGIHKIKKITKKFKKIFESYDYSSQNNKVLLALIDLIIEMMTIVDNDDNVYIKKLSSFLKVLSSDFCLDVINEKMIIEIYNTQIVGILDYLDNKYGNPETEQSMNDMVKDFLMEDILDYNNDTYVEPDPTPVTNETKCKLWSNRSDNIHNTYSPPPESEINSNIGTDVHFKEPINSRYEYEKLFDIVKETSNSMYQIYQNKILNGRYSNITSILTELRGIKESVKLTCTHPNYSLRSLSSTICGLCDVLIGISERGKRPNKLMKSSIKSSFDFINNIKYSNS